MNWFEAKKDDTVQPEFWAFGMSRQGTACDLRYRDGGDLALYTYGETVFPKESITQCRDGRLIYAPSIK